MQAILSLRVTGSDYTVALTRVIDLPVVPTLGLVLTGFPGDSYFDPLGYLITSIAYDFGRNCYELELDEIDDVDMTVAQILEELGDGWRLDAPDGAHASTPF